MEEEEKERNEATQMLSASLMIRPDQSFSGSKRTPFVINLSEVGCDAIEN